MIKALTDQTESVIMKAVILSHPPFEIPDLDSQEPGVFIGNCRIRSLPSGIELTPRRGIPQEGYRSRLRGRFQSSIRQNFIRPWIIAYRQSAGSPAR